MLHLIFGMAGAGKTTLLYERIADCVSGGGRAILLVPEQYSFESERLFTGGWALWGCFTGGGA